MKIGWSGEAVWMESRKVTGYRLGMVAVVAAIASGSGRFGS